MILTGLPVSHAASAVCAWFDMSSLPPNAPPFDTNSVVMRDVSTPSIAAMSFRSSQIPCPPEYT